jgi:predicted transcriptional regulator of viral defense system
MAIRWSIASISETEKPIDAAIAEIARAQHGVVSLAQLVALGLSASAVRSRVARGSLHPIHRGVYAVGHQRLTLRGRWMAAVLAGSEATLLASKSSAHLQGLLDTSGRIEIVDPARGARRVPGLIARTSATLTEADVTVVDGIPCTDWARTVIDLAAHHRQREVEIALIEQRPSGSSTLGA